MKTWKIPVAWSMCGIVNIEANTLEDAIELAMGRDGNIPITDDGTFIDGTWEVDCDDDEYIRKYYNDGQEDENDAENRV